MDCGYNLSAAAKKAYLIRARSAEMIIYCKNNLPAPNINLQVREQAKAWQASGIVQGRQKQSPPYCHQRHHLFQRPARRAEEG
jgi:hypothetical protein